MLWYIETCIAFTENFGRDYIHIVYIIIITDHNECLTNENACDQNCHNSHGSYTCSCNTGYRLEADLTNCEGEDATLNVLYNASFTYHYASCVKILMSALITSLDAINCVPTQMAATHAVVMLVLNYRLISTVVKVCIHMELLSI